MTLHLTPWRERQHLSSIPSPSLLTLLPLSLATLRLAWHGLLEPVLEYRRAATPLSVTSVEQDLRGLRSEVITRQCLTC